MGWKTLALVMVTWLVVATMAEEWKKTPSGYVSSSWVRLSAKYESGWEVMGLMVFGIGIAAVVIATFLAVLISLLVMWVMASRMDKNRSRFLDTRIAQFVERRGKGAKGGAGDDTGEKTADDIEPEVLDKQPEILDAEDESKKPKRKKKPKT